MSAAIVSRQLDLLCRNVRLAQWISIGNASLLVGLWFDRAGPLPALAWWLFACATAFGRMSVARRYLAARTAEVANNDLCWLKRIRTASAVGGGTWACGALLFILTGDPVQAIFTGFVMAGMVAGAVPALGADRLAFRCYAWPIVAATAIAAFSPDALHIAFSVMAVFFLIGSTHSADRLNATLLESLRLEQEKDALVGKLQLAREVAERSDRAKTEFLANISHELLTPMNGILGMAQLMEMEPLSAEQTEYLALLHKSGNDLLALIHNLIELSALEAGQVRLDERPFTFAEFLPKALEQAEQQAAAKGLAFSWYCDVEPKAQLLGDPERLKKLLGHLADNAVKFTDRGGVDIRVRRNETVSGKAELEIAITDTGPGIPADKLASVFESFSQADASATRRHGGTGIGLPLCVRLARLIGGSLTAESQLGVGSTFLLRLPLRPAGEKMAA